MNRKLSFAAVLSALLLFIAPVAASASVSLSIGSLSGTNVTVGTGVSFTVVASGFTNPTYSISDSFGGSSIGNGDINSSNGNFNWTPNGNDVGTHSLTITVSDASGNSATTQETLVVSQAPSVSIQSLSPSTNITTSQTLTFSAVALGFTNPIYSISDSFGGSSVGSGNINSSGNFSWTPQGSDIGTHTITIHVSDSSGHSISTSETVTVSNTSVAGTTGTGGATVQGLSPGSSIIIGQPVTFTVAASGFTNPAFSVSDSFSGGTISNADINTAGYFAWTPTSNDAGTHNLIVYVNDSSGHSGNVSLTLSVNQPNIAITTINPGTVVLPNSPLTFTVTPQGFSSPSYTLSDSFSGTTITNADISSSGAFSWTPTIADTGTHTITVYATDAAGHSANTSITININSGVSVSLTAPMPNSSVTAGTAVTLTAYAFGFTAPAFTVQDAFSGSSVVSSDINSNGTFSWTPTNTDVGTHSITVTAKDIYGHVGSAVTSVTVSAGASTASSVSSGSTLSSLQAQLASAEAEIATLGGSSASSASSASGSGYVFSTYLSPGLTSNDVTELQTMLTQQGLYSGPITGYYGDLTENAVIAFQAAHGIDQLGVVGPATRAALNALGSGSSSSTASSSSGAGDGYVFSNFIGSGDNDTDVTELQKRLTALGVYSGPITGYFGSLTQAAVEQFQSAHGINAVGYVGPGTRAALNQ